MRLRYSTDEAVKKDDFLKGEWPLVQKTEFPYRLSTLERPVWWIYFFFLLGALPFQKEQTKDRDEVFEKCYDITLYTPSPSRSV